MATPDVSVVIPTYNRAVQVEKAIASIDEPALHVEIVVVDDGSTDDTVRRLAARTDLRLVRLSHNGGAAAARNAGIEVARAPYVAFLDSDDVRLPGTLAVQLHRLAERPECALVHGSHRRLGEAASPALRPPEGDAYDHLLHFNVISPSCAVVRVKVLRELGGFDPRYRRSEEWDLWLRICSRYPVCAVEENVVVIDPATDASHLSGDPVLIESTSVEVLRRHLASRHSRIKDPATKRRVLAEFVRNRIDLMIWKVLARGRAASPWLRLRCAVRCAMLSPSYMLEKKNLKNLAKLLGAGDTGSR
jgi:glycosyltransferase involved in cell wall biosynthesis